ncbi:MAG: hypothetical protein EZS28_046564 [Streblomastix strix]|uniref:Uncharacterized protein n=1 Tax=Streblomastix strix TaxID=222440 RepID=A0A5J4TID5_9EUKA|nr:MAG: hypothetical protein EZS28_046564 [Streblomastix strix]
MIREDPNAKSTRGQIDDATAHIFDTAQGAERHPQCQETYQKLQQLHMQTGNGEVNKLQPDEAAPHPEELIEKFTLEFFMMQISSLKSGSTAGASGWNVNAIKHLTYRNQSHTRLLTEFFSALLKNAILLKMQYLCIWYELMVMINRLGYLGSLSL